MHYSRVLDVKYVMNNGEILCRLKILKYTYDLDNLICVCIRYHRVIEGMTLEEVLKYIKDVNPY